MRLKLRSICALPLICGSLLAQADAKTSTPAERTYWVEVLHSLEANPTDAATIHEAEGVFKRLVEVTDFHMTICPVIIELPNKYANTQPIMQLYTLGLASYQVETGKTDNAGANLYALHSVLKGYSAILGKDPAAHDKKLDNLAKLDAGNKLPELIAKKGCK